MILALIALVVLPLIINYVELAHSAQWLALVKWPLLLLRSGLQTR